jgi:hypothetical protein
VQALEGCRGGHAHSSTEEYAWVHDQDELQAACEDEADFQMMPCFRSSACSSPDTQPKTFGSPSSFWTK